MHHELCHPVRLRHPSQTGMGLLHQMVSFSFLKDSYASMLPISAVRWDHQDARACYSALFRQRLTLLLGCAAPRSQAQPWPAAQCPTTFTQISSMLQLCPIQNLSDWTATTDFFDCCEVCSSPPGDAHCSLQPLTVTYLERRCCKCVKETVMSHIADSANRLGN